MSFDNVSYERQPQPRPVFSLHLGLFGTKELLEDVLERVFCNPDPCVRHGDLDWISSTQAYLAGAALRCILYRVSEQVIEGLSDLFRIRIHRRVGFRRVDRDGDRLLLGQG